MAEYRVIAAAVRVAVGNRDLLVERDQSLPDDVTEADIKRLVDKGMVVQVKPAPKSKPKTESEDSAEK